MPAYLDSIYDALGDPFTPDYVLMNHSVFKYYTPFARKQDVERAINILRSSEGRRSANLIGINKNTIVSGIDLLFCSTCAINEVLNYGEAHFHISHNLEGIKICSKCGGILKPYIIKDKGKRDYVSLDTELISEVENELDHYDQHLRLAKLSEELITMNPANLNYDEVLARYKILLLKNGLVYSANRVMQQKIKNVFCEYYNNNFLRSISCEITNKESCWIHRFTYYDIIHPLKPIEHLLIIGLFCNSIKDFIDIDTNTQYQYPTLRKPEAIGRNIEKLKEDKGVLYEALQTHFEWDRNDIREHYTRQYNYVYKHDREWMLLNLPPKKDKRDNKKHDYLAIDDQYVKELKKEVERIINLRPPVRVTYERLNAALKLHHISSLQKLPLTQAYMKMSVETAEDFRIRKCKIIVDDLYAIGIVPELYLVRLKAKICNYQRMNSIKDEICGYIEEKKNMNC